MLGLGQFYAAQMVMLTKGRIKDPLWGSVGKPLSYNKQRKRERKISSRFSFSHVQVPSHIILRDKRQEDFSKIKPN